VVGAVTGAASLAHSQFVSPGRHCYACNLICAICSNDSLLWRNRSVVGVNLCKGAVPMSFGSNDDRVSLEKKSRNTRVVGANDAPRALVGLDVSRW
jgi:hypothetical protein